MVKRFSYPENFRNVSVLMNSKRLYRIQYRIYRINFPVTNTIQCHMPISVEPPERTLRETSVAFQDDDRFDFPTVKIA